MDYPIDISDEIRVSYLMLFMDCKPLTVLSGIHIHPSPKWRENLICHGIQNFQYGGSQLLAAQIPSPQVFVNGFQYLYLLLGSHA